MFSTSMKSLAAGEIKYPVVCLGWKKIVPGATFLVDTSYHQKKFRSQPKTQTFTVIISGSYLTSIHPIFWHLYPMFYGATL